MNLVDQHDCRGGKNSSVQLRICLLRGLFRIRPRLAFCLALNDPRFRRATLDRLVHPSRRIASIVACFGMELVTEPFALLCRWRSGRPDTLEQNLPQLDSGWWIGNFLAPAWWHSLCHQPSQQWWHAQTWPHRLR